MKTTMKIEISQLYKLKKSDSEKLVMTYMSACYAWVWAGDTLGCVHGMALE